MEIVKAGVGTIDEVIQTHAIREPNPKNPTSDPKTDPPPYSEAPPKDELTLEKSECWKEGRKRFTTRLTNGKEPDKALTAELNRFFDKTRTLQKTIDRCEEIQASAEKRSDSVGKLVDVLSSFKTVGDGVFLNAPGSIGAVWFAIGFVIKIVADHSETCQIVADVYNQVSKIAIASLLYEERCSRLGPRKNRDGNIVALEGVIMDNIATLVCEILDFFWNTQRWAVKLQSTSALESKINDGPAQPKLTRTPTIARYEESKIKTKSNSLGHEIGHGVKVAGKKVGEVVKGSVKHGMDVVKSGRDKIIEALTGELKEKAQKILDLYGILHPEGSLHFEEMVLDSLQSKSVLSKSSSIHVPDELYLDLSIDVRNHLRDLQAGLHGCLHSIEDSMKRVEEKQDVSLENDEAILKGIKQLQETQKSQIFEKYTSCFRRSVVHENLIQTLYTKKAQDGAANDRSWLLKQEKYKAWKSCSPKSSRILCLKAKRGHGKTMTLLSVTTDLEAHRVGSSDVDPDSTFVLRFFFKLGDNELQSTLRAFESLLRQLLEKISGHGDSTTQFNDRLEKVCRVLEKNDVDTISKEIQSGDTGAEGNMATSEVSRIISQISAQLNLRLYIVLDALDECDEMKGSDLVHCLKDLAYSKGSNIWILTSTRDSPESDINIENEFLQNGVTLANPLVIQQNIPSVGIVSLTKNENTEELQAYLQVKLRDLVSRRVRGLKPVPRVGKAGINNYDNLGTSEAVDEKQVGERVKDLAGKVNKIVNGDFSYAGMLIANLQEPSKKTLEARIKELEGRGLEDMYRRNLDVLTPGKRTLILFALKWVVWTVSDITAVEIAEHFREVYHDTEASGQGLTEAEYDPRDDPEIREIISHLRTAGRDFFSFGDDYDPVTAHASVREWIQNSSGSSAAIDLTGSEARIVKSVGGRLVFEIAVPSESIPKGYDELSELMSEEESHLSIASDLLRALTSKNFQARYMPWNPPKKDAEEVWDKIFPKGIDGFTPGDGDSPRTPTRLVEKKENNEPKRLRYEIRSWRDHISALDKYRHDPTEEAKNPKWCTLRSLLDKFIQPENWYRWHIQREGVRSTQNTMHSIYSAGRYREPIHVACDSGLQLLLEQIYASSEKEDSKITDIKDSPSRPSARPLDEEDGVLDRCDGEGCTPLVCSLTYPKITEFLLNAGAKVNKVLCRAFEGLTPLYVGILLTDTGQGRNAVLESVKLLLKHGAKDGPHSVLESTLSAVIRESVTKETIDELQKAYTEITAMLLESYNPENQQHALSPDYLFLSAITEISKYPSQGQEIWNRAKFLVSFKKDVFRCQDSDSLTPLHLLVRAIYDHPDHAETLTPMVEWLVEKGADPLVSYTGPKKSRYYGNPVLLAVQTRNPKLFDIFFRKEKNLFQSKSLSGACAMHYFFKDKHKEMSEEDRKLFDRLIELSPPLETSNRFPNDPKPKILESGTQNNDTIKVPYFIDAEDNDSRRPLSWAIESGDKDGVKLLLQHGAEVDDVDELGRTGLYYLAKEQGKPGNSIIILRELHKAGADIRISAADQVTVFAQAARSQPPSVLREFVRILPKIEQNLENYHEGHLQEPRVIDGNYLLQVDQRGQNFLHSAADRGDTNSADMLDILEGLIQSLTEDDRRELLSQTESDALATPLDRAVDKLNFPLINMLSKYSLTENNTLTQNSRRKSPLEVITMRIRELERKVSETKNHIEARSGNGNLKQNTTDTQNKNKSRVTSKGISNQVDYEQEMVTLLGLSKLDAGKLTAMHLREFGIWMAWDSYLQALEARGVALGALDEYGWNAFHLAKHYETDLYLFSDVKTSLESLPPYPSKFQTDSSLPATISQDGLEVTNLGDMVLTIQADNPIDLSSGRYYFEVQVKKIPRSECKRLRWWIGIIPMFPESWSIGADGKVDTNFGCGIGWYGDDSIIDLNTDPMGAIGEVLPEWGQCDSNEMDTIGLGIDRKTASLFFTKNGEHVGDMRLDSKCRCFPALSVPKGCTARANFGGSVFEYKGWDGSLEKTETPTK
ncbi:hypothetical protein TWF718_002940 [Orbilia javanica]|uniref:B30.2/SPRY domain-containing protein n=1 Tax=Orbilia javanica TaxID=47235 RepID=A0AAN8R9A5_9PEZI